MITVNATMSQLIKIGHQGENKAVQVAFDLTPFQAAFQGGYPQLVVRRPGDQSGYPVALIVDGSKAIWIVSASDTEKAGHGQCELQWFVGDALAKSDKYNYLVYAAIPSDAEPPDSPSKAWFEKILSDIGDLSDLDTEAKENLVAAINEARHTGGGGAGGTSDHKKLSNRDAADQHPIAAITGLEAALAGKQPTGNYLTNEALAGAVDDALAQAKASGEFDGADGKTAYQYAQDGGYTGTEAEFAEKLAAEIPAIDNTLSKAGQAADAAKVGEEISSLSEDKVNGIGIATIMAITQTEYDGLVTDGSLSENTLYIIVDDNSSEGGGGSGGSTENLIPYLESDGTAYIKLGITPVDGASYEVCIRASDGIGKGCVFGNRWTLVSGAGGSPTKQWMIGYYNGSAYATFGSSAIDVSKKRVFTVNNNSLVLDNDVVTEITAGTNTKASIMYLFAQNTSDKENGEYLGGVCAFTFFYLKIRNTNGDLLYDYRPAQGSDGVACVYEAVNKTYLYNAADSGMFTYGEELGES